VPRMPSAWLRKVGTSWWWPDEEIASTSWPGGSPHPRRSMRSPGWPTPTQPFWGALGQPSSPAATDDPRPGPTPDPRPHRPRQRPADQRARRWSTSRAANARRREARAAVESDRSAPSLWESTDADLDEISPPLTAAARGGTEAPRSWPRSGREPVGGRRSRCRFPVDRTPAGAPTQAEFAYSPEMWPECRP